MDLASKETEISSGYERKSPDKNVLTANHTGNQSYCKPPYLITNGNHTGNEAYCISPDFITSGNHTGNEANCISCDLIANGNDTGKEDNYASLDLIANGNQTGNEANCISPDLIANGNHTGKEDNYASLDLITSGNHTGNEANCISPDLIANGNQTRNEAYWMPPDLITSRDHIRNRSKNEKANNESIQGYQSMVVCLGQFKEWPALRIEFSPADCYDGSNSQMLSALPSINPNDDLYDDTVRCHNTSSGIGESRGDNGDHMPVTPANPVLKESLESSKDLLDAGYWIQNNGFDYNENLTLSFEDPLKDGTIVKDVAVKIRKGEIAVNKSVMCPVRSNKRGPVSVDICVQIVLSFSSLKCVIFPSNEKKEKDLKV